MYVYRNFRVVSESNTSPSALSFSENKINRGQHIEEHTLKQMEM